MPPKPKFTREEVIDKAIDFIRQYGIDELTTRALGEYMGSSARPIFTLFKNMDELMSEVKNQVYKIYGSYRERTDSSEPTFKRAGMQMVLFGKYEKRLYQLMFMKENINAHSFDAVFQYLGAIGEECIEYLKNNFSLSEKDARFVFDNVWIYTYGVGTLLATDMCDFTEDELSSMLAFSFLSTITEVQKKSGKENGYKERGKKE